MGKKRTKQTPRRGGKRPGAGRPPEHQEGASVKLSATVPEALLARLDEWAAKQGKNRSQAVTEAIRRIVG